MSHAPRFPRPRRPTDLRRTVSDAPASTEDEGSAARGMTVSSGPHCGPRNRFEMLRQHDGAEGNEAAEAAESAPGNDVADIPAAEYQADVESDGAKHEDASTSNEIKIEAPRGLPRACLFVASLNAARTEPELHESVLSHFSPYGPIVDVKAFKDTSSRPYAFVQFVEPADADRANVELQGSVLDSRKIRIEQAKVHRSLFISRHDAIAFPDPDQMRTFMEEFGPLEDFSLLSCATTGIENSRAFVKFCYRDDAIEAYLAYKNHPEYAINWSNHVMGGRGASGASTHMGPGVSPSAAAMSTTAPVTDKTSLFIGQLNQDEITQEMLEERFAKYGHMVECKLVNRQGNQPFPRCAFAFIRYDNEDAAIKAIAAEDGARWLGHNIRVQFREPRELVNYRKQRATGRPYMHPMAFYYPSMPYIPAPAPGKDAPGKNHEAEFAPQVTPTFPYYAYYTGGPPAGAVSPGGLPPPPSPSMPFVPGGYYPPIMMPMHSPIYPGTGMVGSATSTGTASMPSPAYPPAPVYMGQVSAGTASMANSAAAIATHVFQQQGSMHVAGQQMAQAAAQAGPPQQHVIQGRPALVPRSISMGHISLVGHGSGNNDAVEATARDFSGLAISGHGPSVRGTDVSEASQLRRRDSGYGDMPVYMPQQVIHAGQQACDSKQRQGESRQQYPPNMPPHRGDHEKPGTDGDPARRDW